MKVIPVSIIKSKNVLFSQNQSQNVQKQPERSNPCATACLIGGVVAALAISSVIVVRSFKNGKNMTSGESVQNNIKNCFVDRLSENDRNYYNKIISLLSAEGIKVNLESLKSIVAPDTFIAMIKKFKPEHFQAGRQISKAKAEGMSLEEFYKNAVDGNFRVSLHTHSNFSDGKASVEEFLECARKYADKVASRNKKDDLPPFTIALTDHDCVDGCKEAIKIIAQNPERFKNLRFVAGCEFSVKNCYRNHDITGLVLNPFDEKLNRMLDGIRKKRRETLKTFLEDQPEFNGKKITLSDIAEYEKQHYSDKGKNCRHFVENGNGIVSVRHAVKFYYEIVGLPKNSSVMNDLGDRDILPIEQVVSTINQNGGFASLTHPFKSFWCFLGERELDYMRKIGVKGIEVNHQYTPSKISQFDCSGDVDEKFAEITDQYRKYAQRYDMFLSGGTDCHETQIFSREPKISPEFLETKLLS